MFRTLIGRLASLILAVCLLLVVCSSASAMTPAPGFAVVGRTAPTNMTPGSEGVVKLYVYNLGGAPSLPGAILTDTLPAGLTATHYEDERGEQSQLECEGSHVVTCKIEPIRPGKPRIILMRVTVDPGASGGALEHVSVSGGGALNTTRVSLPVIFSASAASPGIAGMSIFMTNPDGTPDTQAGSHPYDITIAVALSNILSKEFRYGPGLPLGNNVRLEEAVGGQPRNANVNLPPGIVGNTQAVPQCPRALIDEFLQSCPEDTQVGESHTTFGDGKEMLHLAVYNMVPPPGVAAQFAFTVSGIPVFIDAGVRTGGDNGVTSHVNDIPQRGITFTTATLWGVPAAKDHDEERCYGTGGGPGSLCPVNAPPKPLLTVGTSCGAPLELTAELLGTWENESLLAPPASAVTRDDAGNPVGLTGCERLQPFKPSISITPDTSYADTPAGLSVHVHMPQELNPEGLQTPGLKDTTVVLPEGVVINPGQATGLVACQPAQEALGKEPDGEVNEKASSCPAASKVGTDELATPLLRDKLKGNIYILGQNPPNLQLLMTASGDGVNIKLVGNVHLDEKTGRLTTTFNETPDVPFTDFTLAFSGGAQAALATPTGCGTYESTADFTPWATPYIADQYESSKFQITAGPAGASCVSPMPFAPTMTAGATTDQAGGYTDFTMLLQRADEQQRIKSLSFKTPEGLLGMISRVPVCEEAQAMAGTCSSVSQIGHTVVGAGPGPYPFYIPQASAPPAPIYLTGPYKGAPFGLSIVVPLIAGPFNLGTEIVRAKIEVDPHTSQITITTDPLPMVVKGIPADLRSIDAVVDRPEFMFNPTDCNPMSFSGTATSYEGATAPLSSHFQMGSCQALKFQPNFKVSTAGKTSRANGASLTAKILYPVGNLGFNQASSQSNIAAAKVDLPKQLPSRLTTLQKACPAPTFETNPAACPPASIVGHARVLTPVLPVPIEGPAYFVSHAGEEFPSLIAVLQGDNVTVDLVGSTFIDPKTNVTTSTFKKVPDVPIRSFELNLPQGKYSALAANGNLCHTKLKMPTAFTAQNGAIIHQNTPINITNCPKTKKTKAKGKHAKGKARKK